MNEDTSEDFFSPTLLPLAIFNDTFVNDDAEVSDPILGPTSGGNQSTFLGAGIYCGAGLKSFEKSYRSIHGYTSLMVCLFGAQANILNLIVLTQREMINPTNAILTGLALADLLNMLEYIPYALQMMISSRSYPWALFVLIHSNFSQVCHTISICLTVTLAVWRYIMVALHVRSMELCSMQRAKWAVATAYILSPILCIPIYLSFSITPITPSATPTLAPNITGTSGMDVAAVITTTATSLLEIAGNMTVESAGQGNATAGDMKYIVNLSDLAKNNPILLVANFWLYSVVIKIIPCILLTVVSLRLIKALMEAKKRKEMLLKKRTSAPAGAGNQTGNGGKGHARPGNAGASASGSDQESGGSDRTTRMLLAVLLLFLITEFPQGLLGLLSGVLGDAFFKSCYIPLADLMDFVALLNSAINFILYCSMSKKFRDTFRELFKLNRLMKLCTRQRTGSRSRVHNTMAKAVPIHVHNHHQNNSSPVAIQEGGGDSSI